jgi:hypothetical protein
MTLIVTVTVPIFIVIYAGFFAARRGVMGRDSIRAFTSFVFYFCLPLMLFHNLANAPVAEEFDSGFVIAYVAAGLSAYSLGYAVARWGFRLSAAEQAVQGLAVSFGHTVFMTIPIAAALYGESSILPVALLISVEMGVIVPLAVVLLEIEKSDDRDFKSAATKAVQSVVKSPIILSIVAGIGVALLGIELPGMLDGIVSLVRGATIPCALFAIGASLAGLSFSERIGETGFLVLGKILIYPLLVFLFMSMVPDLSPQWKSIAIIAAATPLGASVYLVASTYDTFVARVSSATLISTVLSVVTLSLLVIVLG